jgi:hypothetical protein
LSIPFSQEFRTVKDNAPLLRELSSRTGGRELPSDPNIANLFDREGLTVPLSLTDFWTLLAILTTIGFLLDVATRRIAFDREALARRWHVLWRGRTIKAEEAMGRLKSTRSEVRDRLSTRGARDKADAHVDGDAQTTKQVAATRFEAGDDAQSISVEDLAGGEADAAPGLKSKKSKSDQPKPADASEAGDEASSMSRLLAAKRRASQQNTEQKNTEQNKPREDEDD